MDEIRRMLDRLSELSDGELEGLEDSIINEFGTVESKEISKESVAEMTFLADSVESVRSEKAKRINERQELASLASEAAARVTENADAPVEDEEVEGEEETPEDETAPPEEFAAEAEELVAKTEELATEATETTEVAEPVELAAEGTETVEVEATTAAAEEPVEAASDAPEAADAVEATTAAGDTAVEEEAPEDLLPPEDVVPPAILERVIGEVVQDSFTEPPPAPEEGILPEFLPEEPVEEPVAEEETTEPEFAARDEGVNATESVEAQMGNTVAGPDTFSAPADRLPAAREAVTPTPISLVAGGDIPGITAGSELDGSAGLANAMSLRLHTLRRASGGRGDQVVVASLIAKFPEDRTLRGNDVEANSEKIKAVTNPATIVASGGWCAPLPVNYDIFDIGGSTDTPLKDSLPGFNADRGGVRYIVPPVLDDYVGAVGIWTNADDIAAASGPTPRKQCLTVACAGEEEVYLDAITTCLCFGNLQTRAFPELIDRHNQLALVEAARFEEIYILNKIKGLSTAVTLPAVLGAARDVLISVERAAVAYRHQHRLDPELPLRFVAPQWLHAMIRSDLTAQLPGDGMDTTFNLASNTIDGFLSARNIRPVWTLDGVGALPTVTDYPDTVEWALFSEGTFTLLDGGTLDIGLVRDMELVSSNDYCMFTEQFMAVAKTGLESLWVTQSLNVNGGSAGTLDVAAVDY